MPYQLDLEESLRDWGLSDYLQLVNGHRTRGSSSFNPGGAVNHHTAGSTKFSIPSLKILIEGRAGLSGPLCNTAQSRSSNFNPKAKFDEVYLVACGRANHAGKGSYKGLVGNSSVMGLEIEHCGDLSREGFSERRQHTAHIIHCAMADAGGYDAEMICQHKDWTPRKIDFVGADNERFQEAVKLNQVARYYNMNNRLGGTPEDDTVWEILILMSYNDARGKGEINSDGSFKYDARKHDPNGYRNWIIAVAKATTESQRMNVVNLLRTQLRDKEGARITNF